MATKSKQKKPKKKPKGAKKQKRERLSKVRGTAPDPKSRRSGMRRL